MNPGCGLDKAMCLGHDDAAQETEDKMKELLVAVQRLQAAMPELYDERNIVIELALNMLETKLVSRAYKVTTVELGEVA